MTFHRPTYGRLEWVDGQWVLSDIPPNVAIRLKAVFPRIEKTQTRIFTMAATPEAAADLKWFFERYPVLMSDEDRARLFAGAQQYEDHRAETESILLPDWQPTERHGFKPGKQPYHMQRQASELALRRKSLLIGDDVGLGKTVTALDAIVGSPYLPAAIVVQPHLANQWARRIEEFTYLRPHIIQGTRPYSLPAANAYIFKYSNIAGWVDVISTGYFKAAIYDEIQELRRGTAAEKGRAARRLSEYTQLHLGLSATPVFNYGSEIWHILQYIDPTVLGPWEDFAREWCTYLGNDKWKVDDPDALGAYLRETGVFLRRLRQGRPINRIPIEVDFDQKVADDAEELARVLAMKVLTGSFVEAGQAARELDAFTRLQTGLAKAKSVAALAKMYLRKGIPIILAGWHHDVYKIWLDELKQFRPVMYTGKESVTQKDRAQDAFVNGDTDVLIISLRSGAGIDGLQKRCSTLIVGELDWSPAIIEQLIGRVDRPGQTAKEITVVFPYVEYGSDPILMRVTAIKKDQQRGINDPGTSLQAIHTDQSHIKALAKDILERSSVS